MMDDGDFVASPGIPACRCTEVADERRQDITLRPSGARVIRWLCPHGNVVTQIWNAAIVVAMRETNKTLADIFTACAAVLTDPAATSSLMDQLELVRTTYGNDAATHLADFCDAVLAVEQRTLNAHDQ